MNKNLEKVCKYLIENKIVNPDLFVDFDEEILIYKEFEWDLNIEFTEVTLKDYDGEYVELVIEDCDQYKLIIDCYGQIELETPEEEATGEIDRLLEVNKELAKRCELLEQMNQLFKSYTKEELEYLKSMQEYAEQEYADLYNRVCLSEILSGVR